MNRPETTRPSENAGSRTEARLFYQRQCVAYWCIQVLVNDQIEAIVCEHHDDFYIRWKDGHYDFVQVKTRAEGEGEWTLADLTRLSILQKLYAKKVKFGKHLPNKYIFLSNMGAGEPKSPNLRTLKTLLEQGDKNWDDKDKKHFNTIFNAIKGKSEYDDEASLRDFCLSLDIQTQKPHSNEEIKVRNCSALQEALLKTHGTFFEPVDVDKIYESILQIVRDASRVEDEANLDKSVAQKTILPEQIRNVIEFSSSGFVYLERIETSPDDMDEKERKEVTTLQQKTDDAHWEPDMITLLIDLRASANTLYRQWRVFDKPRKRLEHLSFKIQRICVGVRADASDGKKQWRLLQKRLEQLEKEEKTQNHQPPVDVIYFIGVVGDLTGKCKNRWVEYDTGSATS